MSCVDDDDDDVMMSLANNGNNNTSTIVFYRTWVYQMQPRNGQNWHSSVGKYVYHNRETARIEFCTSRKSVSISVFVDTRDKVNAD